MNHPPQQNFERGQGIVEYALIIALAVLVVMLALPLLGTSVADIYQQVVDALTGEDGQGLLFREDFSGGFANWDDVKWSRRSSDDWSVENGFAIGSHSSGKVVGDKSFSDFVMEVGNLTMNVTGSSWNGASLFFRADNSDNINGYSFRIQRPNGRDPGSIYFSKWANGYQVGSRIAEVPAPPGFDWNGTYDVAVSAQGNQFTASINGQQVMTGTDDTYTDGTVGFYSHAGSTISVDNVIIRNH